MKMSKQRPRQGEGRNGETSLTRFVRVHLDRLTPATINDTVYKPIDPNEPATLALVERMRRLGWVGAMAVTTDHVIISGHRRRVAARLAGIEEVDVEVLPITSDDPRFAEYLVSYNEQRKKSPQEEIREQVALTSPGEAYARLIAFREAEARKVGGRAAASGLSVLVPAVLKARSEISDAKRPMLDEVVRLIEQYRGFWPLTLRQVHYRLLPLKVRRNSRDPESTYINDRASYQDLSRLLVRARLAELVPFDCLEDETRPQIRWRVWDSIGPFMRQQLDSFCVGYRRNLQQSQPAHVLLFLEKMTVQTIGERAASPYHVPVCVGRGYPSITAIHDMAEAFFRSGKDHMILLIASDFDPEGENIASRLTASLRDEFGVADITSAKVALTLSQVEELNLPPMLEAKETSSRAARFIEEHGRTVYELEAVEPEILQGIISRAIESVLDLDLLRQEKLKEAEDARQLEPRRAHMVRVLNEIE
jgi:hypothetical protein